MERIPHQFVSLHIIDDNGAFAETSAIMAFINHQAAGVSPDAQHVATCNNNNIDTSPASNADIMSLSGTDTLRPTVLADAYIKTVIGLKYHVVGVFGGQSSGKSTLLNHVFGTVFKTMDAEGGRQQTTKGAFLAICSPDDMESSETPHACDVMPKKNPILVVDFEGTDGVERGEDQSFERQLSLFALSIADTLIINMWTVEVGRFNAANLSLLRTVFEVNLQLFSHSANLEKEKPTLLFVMRDHTAKDVTHNAERVRTSIDKIWETIHKPAGSNLEGCKIDRLFNIQFFGFPHYELQKDEFFSCVKDFRRLFMNGDGEETNNQMPSLSEPFIEGNTTKSVFESPLTFRGIPLESLPQYLSNCWASIQTSKDLDIPSQREMVSRIRCKELADERIATYRGISDEYTVRIETYEELVPDLKKIIEDEYKKMLDGYMVDAQLYSPSVVEYHRVRLCNEMNEVYEAIIKAQIKLIVNDVMRNMDADIHMLVDVTIRDVIWKNEKILKTVDLPLPVDSSDLSAVGSHELDISGADVNTIVSLFWKRLAMGITRMCESASDSDNAEVLFGRWWGMMTSNVILHDMVLSQLTVEVTQCIKKRLEGMTNDISISMHKTFEYVLNHNKDGGIRFFTSIDGLQRQYRPARFAGLVLAACLFYFRLKLRTEDKTIGKTGSDTKEKNGNDNIIQIQSNSDFIPLTINNMTSTTVYSEDNEEEKLFHISLGTAHVRPEISASDSSNTSYIGESGNASRGTISLPQGVRYPAMAVRVQRSIAAQGAVADGERMISGGSNDNGVITGKVLISKGGLQRSLDLYFQQINFTFCTQMKNVEASRAGSAIPIWFWGLLLFFGYDDIIRLFYSPVLLAMIVVLASVFCSKLIADKWKEFEQTGPPIVVQIIRYAIVCAKPYIDTIRDQTKPMEDDVSSNNDFVNKNATPSKGMGNQVSHRPSHVDPNNN